MVLTRMLRELTRLVRAVFGPPCVNVMKTAVFIRMLVAIRSQ